MFQWKKNHTQLPMSLLLLFIFSFLFFFSNCLCFLSLTLHKQQEPLCNLLTFVPRMSILLISYTLHHLQTNHGQHSLLSSTSSAQIKIYVVYNLGLDHYSTKRLEISESNSREWSWSFVICTCGLM